MRDVWGNSFSQLETQGFLLDFNPVSTCAIDLLPHPKVRPSEQAPRLLGLGSVTCAASGDHWNNDRYDARVAWREEGPIGREE